uniref:U1 small nuclear ribonucleoprotein C n=1 Tax=Romanomermis culicivorax TaxID=13658 RepID=A0A915KIZ4_ROMCU
MAQCAEEIDALLEAQETIRSDVRNFTFNLGYCGKFFGRNGYYEDEGDYRLVEHAQNFTWFPHQWRHSQPHLWNLTMLKTFMRYNERFAKLQLIGSGGFRIFGTMAKPMVLPRQTCGLYTHTTLIDNYPGGRERLDSSIQGGELFFTFVLNKFLIFMTHQSNYAQERLALYTFISVLRFIRCYTNIELRSIPPPLMADKYFAHYPSEKEPIWGQLVHILAIYKFINFTLACENVQSLNPEPEVSTAGAPAGNPCTDKRHIAIWAAEKLCDRIPHFFVVGPQKTGTTALHKFLKLHPQVVSNHASNKTFEEIQFFSSKYYKNGVEWLETFKKIQLYTQCSYFRYLNRFPSVNKSTIYLFEKSSTYFDSESSPKRLKAFTPGAKIIVTIVNPIDRAYSWYQIVILDGDVLKRDPIKSMQIVQKFLNFEDRIDYSKLLRSTYTTKMPKYYCDYCDTYLTHDSPSVRKTHNGGRKHKESVRMYYQQWMEEQAQKLVDATAKAFKEGKMVGMPPGMLRPPGGAMMPPPMGFGRPPMAMSMHRMPMMPPMASSLCKKYSCPV